MRLETLDEYMKNIRGIYEEHLDETLQKYMKNIRGIYWTGIYWTL
jgi:hypothetical protein